MAAKWYREFGRCNAPACNKPAGCELFNQANASLGKFCIPHAKKAIERDATDDERIRKALSPPK